MRLPTRLLPGIFLIPNLLAAQAHGQVDALTSIIPDCITIAPGTVFVGNPIGSYSVTVNNVDGAPVPGATVTLTFDPGVIPLIAWCGGVPPGAPPGTLVGVTDAVGLVTLGPIMGGGCVITPVCGGVGGAVATVTVEGTAVDPGIFVEPVFCINSPDAVDLTGFLPACPAVDPPSNNCMAGVTGAALGDAVFHTAPIKFGLASVCTKFAPPFDGPVALIDAVLLTPYIKVGVICPC
jgi:hypothetical protein